LAHFDPDKDVWIETDASDFAYGAIMLQIDDNRNLRPVAFLSKKMIPAESNYDVYDKELLAIVHAFEDWEPELMSILNPITVFTDYQNLQSLMSTKKLSR
jgi:hypothetical protein